MITLLFLAANKRTFTNVGRQKSDLFEGPISQVKANATFLFTLPSL